MSILWPVICMDSIRCIVNRSDKNNHWMELKVLIKLFFVTCLVYFHNVKTYSILKFQNPQWKFFTLPGFCREKNCSHVQCWSPAMFLTFKQIIWLINEKILSPLRLTIFIKTPLAFFFFNTSLLVTWSFFANEISFLLISKTHSRSKGTSLILGHSCSRNLLEIESFNYVTLIIILKHSKCKTFECKMYVFYLPVKMA